jgi:hypothetical protein
VVDVVVLDVVDVVDVVVLDVVGAVVELDVVDDVVDVGRVVEVVDDEVEEVLDDVEVLDVVVAGGWSDELPARRASTISRMAMSTRRPTTTHSSGLRPAPSGRPSPAVGGGPAGGPPAGGTTTGGMARVGSSATHPPLDGTGAWATVGSSTPGTPGSLGGWSGGCWSGTVTSARVGQEPTAPRARP